MEPDVTETGRRLALGIGVALLMTVFASTTHAALFADTFERPDGPDLGPLWVQQWPEWCLAGGTARSIETDRCSLMTVSDYEHPEPAVQATVTYAGDPRLHYVALVVLYQDNEQCVFVKLQDGYEGCAPDGLYDTAYFYLGNNSQVPWGDMAAGFDDWVDLWPYFSTATVALAVVGDTVSLAVDRDLDGDFLGPNDSLYARGGLPLDDLGLGIGVGGYDGACVDDFYAMPEPATATLLVLGTVGWAVARRKR